MKRIMKVIGICVLCALIIILTLGLNGCAKSESKDVTYTSVQLEDDNTNPYAYDIQFFPTDEVIKNGLVDISCTDY